MMQRAAEESKIVLTGSMSPAGKTPRSLADSRRPMVQRRESGSPSCHIRPLTLVACIVDENMAMSPYCRKRSSLICQHPSCGKELR